MCEISPCQGRVGLSGAMPHIVTRLAGLCVEDGGSRTPNPSQPHKSIRLSRRRQPLNRQLIHRSLILITGKGRGVAPNNRNRSGVVKYRGARNMFYHSSSSRVRGLRLCRVGNRAAMLVPCLIGYTARPVIRGRLQAELQNLLHRWREKNERIPSGPRSAGPQSWRCDMMTGSERML